MKMLLIYTLLLLAEVTIVQGTCVAQLDDLFFYKMIPLPCNKNAGTKGQFKNAKSSNENPRAGKKSKLQVQMDRIIGLINAAGELLGDSRSRFKEMGVSFACIKKMQEQALEAMEKGEWKAFSVFENGSVYEILPVVPIFHHQFFKTPKSPKSKTNK